MLNNTNTTPTIQNTSKEIPKISKEQTEVLRIRQEKLEQLKKKAQEGYVQITLLGQLARLAIKHFFLISSVILLWIYVYHPAFWDQILIHAMRLPHNNSITEQVADLIEKKVDIIKTTIDSTVQEVKGSSLKKDLVMISVTAVLTTILTVSFLYLTVNHTN